MTQPLSLRRLVVLTAFGALPVPAFGLAPAIDYLGYGWETGGLPPGDPVFGLDLLGVEGTFHDCGMVSAGEVDFADVSEMSWSRIKRMF